MLFSHDNNVVILMSPYFPLYPHLSPYVPVFPPNVALYDLQLAVRRHLQYRSQRKAPERIAAFVKQDGGYHQ